MIVNWRNGGTVTEVSQGRRTESAGYMYEVMADRNARMSEWSIVRNSKLPHTREGCLIAKMRQEQWGSYFDSKKPDYLRNACVALVDALRAWRHT